MKADRTITELTDVLTDLTYSAVVIREWDGSPILYVIGRVEYMETCEQLLNRAEVIAKTLTVERPPKRLSAQPLGAADID